MFATLIKQTGPDWPAVTGTAGPHKERTGLDGSAGRHRIAGPLIERIGPDWPAVTGKTGPARPPPPGRDGDGGARDSTADSWRRRQTSPPTTK